jgi:ferredoxin
MIVLYLPQASHEVSCKNCIDCVNACPVKAIRNSGKGLIFDRVGCAEYVAKMEECLECITVCKAGAISMKCFVKDTEGKWVRET